MTKLPFREAVAELKLYEGSLYAHKLRKWQAIFGTQNVHLLFMDDLANDPETYTQQLCQHLGLDYQPLPDYLKQKIFGAAASPNYLVAKIVNTTAQFLRSFQLYGVVNFLKNTPLRGIIFGKPKEGQVLPKLSSEDRAWLLDTYFKEDISDLEELLGKSFTKWKTANL